MLNQSQIVEIIVQELEAMAASAEKLRERQDPEENQKEQQKNKTRGVSHVLDVLCGNPDYELPLNAERVARVNAAQKRAGIFR